MRWDNSNVIQRPSHIFQVMEGTRKTKLSPNYFKTDAENLLVTSPEEFFTKEKQSCLPAFSSVTIESQLYNIPITTDGVSIYIVVDRIHP